MPLLRIYFVAVHAIGRRHVVEPEMHEACNLRGA